MFILLHHLGLSTGLSIVIAIIVMKLVRYGLAQRRRYDPRSRSTNRHDR